MVGRGLLAAGVLVLALGGGAPAQTCPATQGQRLVDLMNQVRVRNELEPLRLDERLVKAARKHARDMAEHDIFRHQGSDGTQPADRVSAQGYAWTAVAENLAAGMQDPARVMDGWMDSQIHRQNILSENATHVGVGFVEDEKGPWPTYWVAVYGASDGAGNPPEGGCHP